MGLLTSKVSSFIQSKIFRNPAFERLPYLHQPDFHQPERILDGHDGVWTLYKLLEKREGIHKGHRTMGYMIYLHSQ